MDKYLCILAELDEVTQNQLKMYEGIILENGLVDKKTKEIPYHVTLNTYSIDNEDYLKTVIDKVGIKQKQIELVYSGFGLFGLNVLYLNPTMNMELLQLYNFVKERNNSKNNVFSAHTTLFIGEPDSVLKLLPQFVDKTRRVSGTLKYVSLYEFSPVRLIKRITLAE